MNFSIWKRFINYYIRPFWKSFIIAGIMMVTTAILTGASAHLIEPIINKVFISKDFRQLKIIAFAIISVFLVKSLATYVYRIVMNLIDVRVSQNLTNDLFKSIIHFDISDISTLSTGKILNHFNVDIRNVKEAINTIVVTLSKEILTIICLIGVMFWKSWELSIISLIGFPIAFYPLVKLSKKLRKISKSFQNNADKMNVYLQNVFDGIRTIKSFTNENAEISKMAKINENISNLHISANKIGSVGSPMMEFMGGFAIAAVMLYGGYDVINNKITAGSFFSFLTALLMLYKPIKSTSNLGMMIQLTYVSLTRIFTLIDTKCNICAISTGDTLDFENASSGIIFNDVSFSYNSTQGEVLSSINLNIQPGQNIALVGNSGSGKSTIAKLLLRFYDTTHGKLILNGMNIKDINITSLRRNISYVGQDPFMFDDTVLANISYGIQNYTQDELNNALKLARADEFVNSLPNGINTQVGHLGNTLSMGQKQRLVIARAILKNAPIVILDEATSSLDNKTEKDIQDALQELIKNKTTIIIAHRLSTITFCDKIYVISDGRIVESGSHQDLLSNPKSTYFSLWNTVATI